MATPNAPQPSPDIDDRQRSLTLFLRGKLFGGCAKLWNPLIDPNVVTCKSAGNGSNPSF